MAAESKWIRKWTVDPKRLPSACGNARLGLESKAGWLPLAIDDSTFCQIVRREFNPDLVAGDDSNEVLAHPTRNVSHHLGARVQLDSESSIRQCLCYGAFYFEGLFFFSQNQTSTESNSPTVISQCRLPNQLGTRVRNQSH